jgi:hypothetical protein
MLKHIANIPMHNSNIPMHNDNIPKHNDNIPKHNDNIPKHNDNIPKHNSNIPRHNSNIPEHNANIPRHNANIPRHNSNIPRHNDNIHRHNSNIPEHNDNLSENNAIVLENNAIVLENNAIVLKNRAIVLENRAIVLKNIFVVLGAKTVYFGGKSVASKNVIVESGYYHIFQKKYLFFPDCINGFYLHGAPGRNQTGGEPADDDDYGGGNGHLYAHFGSFEKGIAVGRGRLHSHQTVDAVEYVYPQAEAQHASHGGEQQAFAHHLRDDIEGLGSEGAPHAYLFGALFDGDHHDVTDADNAGQEGPHPNEPNQHINAGEEHVEGGELGCEVDGPNGLRIVWSDFVLSF